MNNPCDKSITVLSWAGMMGKEVWILFEVPGGGDKQFYRGIIKKMMMDFDDDGETFRAQHYVVFDDGDEFWYNLQEKEAMDQLCWEKPPTVASVKAPSDDESSAEEINTKKKAREAKVKTEARSSVNTKREAPSDDESSVEVIKKKVRKAKTETDAKTSRSPNVKREAPLEDDSNLEVVNTKKMAGKVKKEAEADDAALDDDSTLSDGNDVDDEAEDDEAYVEAEVAEIPDPPALEAENQGDESIRNWIDTLGIQGAYGMGVEALSDISSNDYVPPKKFEHVFLLADFLIPGYEYHHRHFVNTTRNKGINVRAKLRTLEKAGDPSVSWHRKNAQWIPPTKEALRTIVEVISGR